MQPTKQGVFFVSRLFCLSTGDKNPYLYMTLLIFIFNILKIKALYIYTKNKGKIYARGKRQKRQKTKKTLSHSPFK